MFWNAGTGMRDLGVLPGWDFSSQAYGINSSGQVVGVSLKQASSATRAFLWTSNDGMLDLNNLLDSNSAGWTLYEADAINDLGQIVGYGISPGGASHAFLLTPVPEPSNLSLVALSGIGLLRSRRFAE